MPFYENVMIARPDISATQVDALTEAMSTIIKDNGGNVTKTEYWGLKNLQYRIKKNRKGHYSLMNIDAPADAIKEMERNMRISEDVIRYLTVRVEELEEGPSVVMQSRGSRDDRGPRGRDRDRGDRDRRDRPEAAAATPAPDAAAEKAPKAAAADETPKAAAADETAKAKDNSNDGDKE